MPDEVKEDIKKEEKKKGALGKIKDAILPDQEEQAAIKVSACSSSKELYEALPRAGGEAACGTGCVHCRLGAAIQTGAPGFNICVRQALRKSSARAVVAERSKNFFRCASASCNLPEESTTVS